MKFGWIVVINGSALHAANTRLTHEARMVFAISCMLLGTLQKVLKRYSRITKCISLKTILKMVFKTVFIFFVA